MPIIEVKNWPSRVNNHNDILPNFDAFYSEFHNDIRFKRKMFNTLRLAVVQAQVPGIEQVDKVTVSFDSGASAYEEEPDKTLCLVVEGLFEREDRDRACRNRLAEQLGQAALKLLPFDWRVEVFVKKFNPDKDSFFQTHN